MELKGPRGNLFEVWPSERCDDTEKKKRNKMGWRYAFARFQGCSSKYDLERDFEQYMDRQL